MSTTKNIFNICSPRALTRYPIIGLCLIIALNFFATKQCLAEFLKLGPLTYASPTGRTFVIVARAPEGSGIFIVHFDAARSVQEFSLADVELGKARTVFIAFEPKNGGFSRVVLPDGKSFALQGALTIALGKAPETRVSIDGTYLTIVSEQNAASEGTPLIPSTILGFSSLELIVNQDGLEAAALLEANKLQLKTFQDVLAKYEVGGDNKLLLNGKEVNNARIGVSTDRAAPCTAAGGLLFSEADLAKIASITDEAAKDKAIEKLKKDPTKAKNINSFVILTILSKSTAVGMDPENGNFIVIKLADDFGDNVCSYKTLKL